MTATPSTLRTPPQRGRLLALLGPLPLALGACAPAASSQEQQPAPWFSKAVLATRGKLGGCAVGDLDPDHPGNEILAVSERGDVFLARAMDGGRAWSNERLAGTAGELIQCTIGDLDPDRPGNEALLVGMVSGGEDDGGPGVAYALAKRSGGWRLEVVHEAAALLHAACIADVDPDSPGAEGVVAGFDRVLSLVTRKGSEWRVEPVAELPGPAKSIVPFRAEGRDGVAVACADGTLLFVAKADSSWSSSVLDHAQAGQARLGGAGELLVVARDDGTLVTVGGEDGPVELFAEEGKLRGAVLADLDPELPGLEAATAGYSGRLTVLHRGSGGWIPRVVHTETDRFHHLAVGELDPASPGPELVACGYTGRLILAGVAPPDRD